jgi:peptidoglycan hydrolase-like protein with peptidoglycan-binding domain
LREGQNKTWPKVVVRSLQYLLDSAASGCPRTGVFGAKTEAAVVAFQRAHHLSVHGAVGARTWAALITTVKPGSTGYAVRAVQDQGKDRAARFGTRLAVDGVFGSTTRLFVRAFQMSADLASDGVGGARTWQGLPARARHSPASARDR